jgi:hypothetical protein
VQICLNCANVQICLNITIMHDFWSVIKCANLFKLLIFFMTRTLLDCKCYLMLNITSENIISNSGLALMNMKYEKKIR